MEVACRGKARVLAGHRYVAEAERGRQVDVLREAGTAGHGAHHPQQRRVRDRDLSSRDVRVEGTDDGRHQRIPQEGADVVGSTVGVGQAAGRVVALGQDDGEAVQRWMLLDVVADAVERGHGSASLGAGERQVDADLDDWRRAAEQAGAAYAQGNGGHKGRPGTQHVQIVQIRPRRVLAVSILVLPQTPAVSWPRVRGG